MSQGQDDTYFAIRRTAGRTYFSARFPGSSGGGERFAVKVWDANGEPRFDWVAGKKKGHLDEKPIEVTVRHEEVVRPIGEKARYQIRARFVESTRKIQEVVLQKFTVKTGKPHRTSHISLSPEQAETLLDFFRAIQAYRFSGGGQRERLDRIQLERLQKDEAERVAFLRDHPELANLLRDSMKDGLDVEGIVRLVTERNIAGSVVQKLLAADLALDQLVVLGQRKRALEIFELLLTDPVFLESTRKNWKCRGVEAVWQRFFEENSWILGYGLQYQFGQRLEGKKLEQVVAGKSISAGGGKRVDVLLKTLGVINSLCFVEIKKHDTDLLEDKEYGGRSDVFSPSRELAGAVAQVQITTQKAMAQIKERLSPVGRDGFETGEFLYAIAPKSMVVCGSLSEFSRAGTHHPAKIRAFELYRRRLQSPEVVTFDELFHRARAIVGTD